MSEPLSRARERRAGMRAAIGSVEASIAAPSPGREDQWRQDVGRDLQVLSDALERHIAETEAPDGLLAEIVQSAPRLAPRVNKTKADHEALRGELAETCASAAAGVDVATLRDRVVDVLVHLVRHRQLGSDLVYEAYMVDIDAAD
jgi:hypothetical protein